MYLNSQYIFFDKHHSPRHAVVLRLELKFFFFKESKTGTYYFGVIEGAFILDDFF